MRNLRHLGAAILLTSILSISAFAGDIAGPGVAGEMHTPGIAGEIGSPGLAGEMGTPLTLALHILQSALSLF